MSSIEKLTTLKCPNGVEYKPLSDKSLFDFHYGKGNKIPEDTGGIYDVYGANGVVSHIDEYNCEDVSIIGHIGAVGMVNRCRGKCFVTYNGTIASVVDKAKVDTQYFYYVLTGLNLASYKKGSQPFLSVSDFENIEIPVPPIEVQQEIVRILDKFTELEAGLQTELDVRKKQYEYYRDSLLTFDTDTRFGRIGDIAVVTKLAGFEFTEYVNYVESGEIIALRGLNVKKGKLDLTDVKYIDGSELSKLTRSKLQMGDMLFTYVGTIGEVALIDEDNRFYLAPNVAMIRLVTDDVIPEFMMYYFQTNQFWNSQINKLLQSSSMKNIPMEKIRKFMIPIPSIADQKRIVEIIKKFDEIAADVKSGLPAEIEARHKQYEYYRDKLLTFERKVV